MIQIKLLLQHFYQALSDNDHSVLSACLAPTVGNFLGQRNTPKDSVIAAIGKKLDIDYAETWSCYKGGEKHCGKCGTCVERKEALAEAGIEDTTEYEE